LLPGGSVSWGARKCWGCERFGVPTQSHGGGQQQLAVGCERGADHGVWQ
ncbi:hypothetical protein NDU88_001176, partial [Pleurodeles waltl]